MNPAQPTFLQTLHMIWTGQGLSNLLPWLPAPARAALALWLPVAFKVALYDWPAVPSWSDAVVICN